MGRLIEEEELQEYIIHEGCEKGCGYIDERDLKYIPTVEAISKADYEARLKADKVAMLEKLKSEIDNMPKYFPYTDHSRWYIDGDVFGLIQQKINSLKEDEENE